MSHLTHTSRLAASALAVISLCAAYSAQAQNAGAQDEAKTLAPVVVTANRTAQNPNDVVADVTIIDRKDIEKSGANTLADVLSRAPGIAITRNGGPAANTSLYVRGAETRFTTVLIDGVRVDSQSTGGASWNSIPLSQVEHIEILRGPCASVYGSDAMAGVIQIFTRKGEPGIQPSVEVGIGSHALRKVNASIAGAQGSFDYALGLGYERSKGFNTKPDDKLANPDADGYNSRSAALRLGYDINAAHRVELTALNSHVDGQYDGYAAKAADWKDDHAINDTNTLGASWKAKWSDAYSSTVSVNEGTDRYETTPSPYLTKTTIRNYLWHNEYRQGEHLLTGALERREDRINNSSLTPNDRKRHQNALALGYGYLGKTHTLQLNLRHDKDSEFGGYTTGGIAYGWHFAPNWRATASVGTAFRAPTLYQRFSEYGVASLQPEKGKNLELGVKYQHAGDEFSVVAYDNKVSNLIAYVAGPGACASPWGCYSNVARAEYKGVTLAAATRVQDFKLGASLDVQKPIDSSTGKLLPRRARQQMTLTADTTISNWQVGAELQYVGKRFDKPGEKDELAAYTLLNLSTSVPLAKDWSLTGRVDNLTNKNYQTAKGYATGGRQFYLGVKWQPQ